MSRLIDADALHKDLEEFYCKDCENSSFFVCDQCNVPELLHMVKTYPSAKETELTAEETELKQKLSEAINKLQSNKKL